MDGLKGVVPNSCGDVIKEHSDLFGNTVNEIVMCNGCKTQNILTHNGKYCKIMDWDEMDSETKSIGKAKRFIDLLNK
jgi:hypothetical protein